MTRPFVSMFLVILVVTLVACNQGGNNADAVEAPANRLVFDSEENRANVLYAMPTPNELFELISEMSEPVNKRAFYDVNLATASADTLERAYRFGICATDLVYASYSDMTSEVVRYYLTTKELSERIGVREAFDRVEVRRLERNLSRGDSLTILSNEAYLKAYQALDQSDRGDILAMVLAGAWVETTHLLIEQIGEYEPENALVDRLVEQKVGLSQLIDLMAFNSEEPAIANLHERLIALHDRFEQVSVLQSGVAVEEKHGKRIFGGSEIYGMDPFKYQEIVKDVATLRGGVSHTF